MLIILKVFLLLTILSRRVWGVEYPEYPDGYYPFEEAPSRTPPKVRKPPYLQTDTPCPVEETKAESMMSLNNLCGDLNKGVLPINPLGQKINGFSYPFDLIKNKTLDFFSKTLPVLKEDKTLPKVAKFQHPVSNNVVRRRGRSVAQTDSKLTPPFEDDPSLSRTFTSGARQGRAFCENNWGLFCLLYNAVSGRSTQTAAERRDGPVEQNSLDETIQPLTPCPSAVEYVTPVFARNYQGIWRYVVQIPYEGYFTQTVESTQCLSKKCHYLSGSCMASPRWVSLLVAEIYYPNAVFPETSKRPNLSRKAVPTGGSSSSVASVGPPYQQHFRRRNGEVKDQKSHYCDGTDSVGCFQVRLYYDWFLIPGSCKCWKQNFFDFNLKK